MKTTSLFKGLFRGGFYIGMLLMTATGLLAQSTSNVIPVVTIQAADQLASWTGDPGVFLVNRAGDPTPALNVYYTISGTASNGVDYQTIGNFVQLPGGVVSNTIVINPINAGQSNIKTVTLHLAPSPLMTPVNYSIGKPDTATVYITPPGVSNIPPVVALTSPTNGSVYTAPATIQLIAIANDADGVVDSVEFFNGSNSLGIVTNFAIVDPPGPPGQPFVPGTRAFFFTWSNVPAGPQITVTNPPPISTTVTLPYVLTAKATDNGGASSLSDPIRVTVLPGPPTNLPPAVRITSPHDHEFFGAPVNIPLFAYAHDFDGTIASVEFFDGTTPLGFGNLISPTPLPVTPLAYSTPVSPAAVTVPPVTIFPPTNQYVFVWSNAPEGAHTLTAVATDNDGATNTSPPVNITVLPLVPPPTNRPAIVSIVATDPIAVEGTNCWPWLGLSNVPPTWSNWVSPTAALCRFTNCGPKDAIFTVRRLGDTSNSLDVTYNIGGTASNGVDYVTLPGVITIPAGARAAQITVVPLEDETVVTVVVSNSSMLVTNTVTNLPKAITTVILALTPSTNTPKDYLVGIPAKAEAVIIDSDRPLPSTAALPDRSFHLSTTGPDGAWFHIESTTDLKSWTPLCTNQVIGGSIDFFDPDAGGTVTRFYRAVPEAGPPAQ